MSVVPVAKIERVEGPAPEARALEQELEVPEEPLRRPGEELDLVPECRRDQVHERSDGSEQEQPEHDVGKDGPAPPPGGGPLRRGLEVADLIDGDVGHVVLRRSDPRSRNETQVRKKIRQSRPMLVAYASPVFWNSNRLR